MAKFKIAIIGAGPAGSTLARLLLQQKSEVDVTIFEGEEGLNARTQGGSLDLHTESGIEALKRAGLQDEFVKKARYDGEGMYYLDHNVKFRGSFGQSSIQGR